MSVKVKIENYYSDGHQSEHEVDLDEPEADDDLDEWFNDVVSEHTGDGHGEKYPKLGVGYVATIVQGPDHLVGETFEWF